MSALDYANMVDRCPTDLNTPGTTREIFYAPRRDFDVLAAAGVGTVIDDWGKVKTAHTFLTGKGFFKLKVVMDENSVQHEMASAKTGGSVRTNVRLFVEGNKDRLRGLVQQMHQDDCIFLIPLKDGSVAQIGSKDAEARVMGSFDTKTDNSTDPRGWEVKLECSDRFATYYDSTLAITEYPV